MSPTVKVTKLDMPLYDEVERLRKENGKIRAKLDPPIVDPVADHLVIAQVRLAKAVAALRQIDTETFTDAPVASLYEIRGLVRAVLEELEK